MLRNGECFYLSYIVRQFIPRVSDSGGCVLTDGSGYLLSGGGGGSGGGGVVVVVSMYLTLPLPAQIPVYFAFL